MTAVDLFSKTSWTWISRRLTSARSALNPGQHRGRVPRQSLPAPGRIGSPDSAHATMNEDPGSRCSGHPVSGVRELVRAKRSPQGSSRAQTAWSFENKGTIDPSFPTGPSFAGKQLSPTLQNAGSCPAPVDQNRSRPALDSHKGRSDESRSRLRQ